MESASEIVHGFVESHSRPEPMQRENVATLCSARVTVEMAVYQRYAHGRVTLVAALVDGATHLRPLTAWLAGQQTMLRQIRKRRGKRRAVKRSTAWEAWLRPLRARSE